MRLPRHSSPLAPTLLCCLLLALASGATGTELLADPLFAGRVDESNAQRRLVGGPDAVGGIGDWALSNGTLCAVVADPEHEGYVLPTGGSLIDLGFCGRGDDQFVILEGLGNLSRSQAPHWTSVEAVSANGEASIRVRGEREGVEITTHYTLDAVRPDVLRLTTRLERREPGPRLFAFGEASIHYEGTLRPYVLARKGRSDGFDHKSTGDATTRELMGAIVPVETVVLIGAPGAEKPISYALRITGAHFERRDGTQRRVPTFGLSTDTVTFLGVLARPVWIGGNKSAGMLQLAQTLFMDLGVGEALVFEREIRVAPRNDAVTFTDALRPGSPIVRGHSSEPDAGLHIVEPDGSAVGFAVPDADGAFALRIPPGSYEARLRSNSGRAVTLAFEVEAEDVDLGTLVLPPVGRLELPEDLAPARLTFRGEDGTPDPVFGDDATGMRVGDEPRPAHTASSHVYLGDFPDDPDHVLLAPGRYRVHASRGPEFDVTSALIEMVAGEERMLELEPPTRVVETPGWISADLHIHAEASDDSTVPMRARLASFVAEGGEILVSTDHDHVSDYAPLIDSLDLGSRVRSIVGLEITSTVATPAAPFTAGHSNVFPLPYLPLVHRKGAIRSEGRRLRDMIADLRELGGERLFQLNHAREPETDAISTEGAFFSHLSVGSEFDRTKPLDAEPNASLIEPDAETGLRDLDFDAIELMNGSSMDRYRRLRDDWFSLLLQGERRTATGNSDTHTLQRVPAVPRNYVRMEDDDPAHFDESEFVASLKAGRSYVSTGPALDVRIAGSVTEGIVHAVLRVGVQSAPWAEVSQLRVFVNGQIADERTIETPSVTDVELRIEADSFVTVEVEGEPGETYRAILPGYVPFAFTNPIYVDADANGSWAPPGI